MPWEPHIHSRHCVDEMYYLIRFGANLLIEEEKVQFPKGKDNLKKYDVSTQPLRSLSLAGSHFKYA